MKQILAVLMVFTTIFNCIFILSLPARDRSNNQFSIIDFQEDLPPPRKEVIPEFIVVEKVRNSEDSIYGDIISHCYAPFGDGHGRSTNAHESTHEINAWIRNLHVGRNINGFYVLEGRGVIIDEPRIRKSSVIEFLPSKLRSYRYPTYITGQMEWDNRPLYIFDEWVCYVNGGMVNVEDVNRGRHREGWSDGVSGCLDFSIYSIALAMAVQKYDPVYWENNKQFRNFLVWHLKRANKTYLEGSQMREFAWEKQDSLLNDFLTSSEAEPMRRFVQENLEGVWLDSKVNKCYFIRDRGEKIRLIN